MSKTPFAVSIALALTVSFTTASSAASQRHIVRGKSVDTIRLANGETAILPQCFDRAGHKVLFSINTRKAMDRGHLALSSYTTMDGARVDFDTTAVNYPAIVVDFVASHECAHHKNGDVLDENAQAFNGQATGYKREKELKADCLATKDMRDRNGYTKEEIGEVFSYFPPDEFSATHPPTAQRLQHALLCFDS